MEIKLTLEEREHVMAKATAKLKDRAVEKLYRTTCLKAGICPNCGQENLKELHASTEWIECVCDDCKFRGSYWI